MDKINQRVMLTKKLLKEALLRILNTKSIAKVSVTELCREAGINRATFYTHYETPHDILLEIGQDAKLEVEKILAATPSASNQMYAEIVCQYLYTHIDLVRLLIRNYSDQSFAALMAYPNIPFPNGAMGENVSAHDATLLNAFISGGAYALINKWLMDDIPRSPKEVATLISGIFSDNFYRAGN